MRMFHVVNMELLEVAHHDVARLPGKLQFVRIALGLLVWCEHGAVGLSRRLVEIDI